MNDNRYIEKIIPAKDNIIFEISDIPKKRRATLTTNIPQLGQRLPTQPSNVAKKSKKGGDEKVASTSCKTPLIPEEMGESHTTLEDQSRKEMQGNFIKISKIKVKFDVDAARINASIFKIRKTLYRFFVIILYII